jgi:hypothetical protein
VLLLFSQEFIMVILVALFDFVSILVYLLDFVSILVDHHLLLHWLLLIVFFVEIELPLGRVGSHHVVLLCISLLLLLSFHFEHFLFLQIFVKRAHLAFSLQAPIEVDKFASQGLNGANFVPEQLI